MTYSMSLTAAGYLSAIMILLVQSDICLAASIDPVILNLPQQADPQMTPTTPM